MGETGWMNKAILLLTCLYVKDKENLTAYLLVWSPSFCNPDTIFFQCVPLILWSPFFHSSGNKFFCQMYLYSLTSVQFVKLFYNLCEYNLSHCLFNNEVQCQK